MNDRGGKGVEAVRNFEFPCLLAGGGVETDDAGFPLLLLRVLCVNLAVALPVEFAADDHDAIFNDGGDAGAVLMNVVSDVEVFPELFAAVVESKGLNRGACAPIDVDAFGVDEGRAAGEAVEVVYFVGDKLDLMTPEFFAIGG